MNFLLLAFADGPLRRRRQGYAWRLACLLWLLSCLHFPFSALSQPNPGEIEPVRALDNPPEEYDETFVVLKVPLVGSCEIPAVIRGEAAYLPVKEVFSFLKIKVEPSGDLALMKGFVINPDATYLIDKKNNQIQYQDKTVPVGPSGLMVTETSLFLRADLFGQVFGLDCLFDFRSLSVTLNTKLELPVIREMQYEKMRQNMMQLRGEKKADTTLRNDFSLLHIGVADWSVVNTTTIDGYQDTRVNLHLGAMLAGGEATALLNYNPGKPFSRRQQLYRWRYVDNDRSLVRQVVLGHVSTKTISSVFGPITGVQLTNTPTTFRRSFGTYRLSNTTQPGWTVELYVNNVLVDYTRADASGFFTFEVPLVYGNSAIKLRFYGPWGEEETREENIVVPFNFLPAQQLEYNFTAGIVADGQNSRLSRFHLNYGLHRSVTIGGGMEYLSSIRSGRLIPFVNASVRLHGNLLLTGEHNHGVRSMANLRYQLPSNMQFEANYVKYVAGQTALRPGRETLLNYQDEKKAVLFIPLRTKKVTAFSRLSLSQLGLAGIKLTTGEFLLSGQYRGVNTNLTTALSYTQPEEALVFSNLAMTFRVLKGTRLTPQLRYEFTTRAFNLAKVEVEKNIFRNGFFNFSYGRNIAQQTNAITVGLRYNFSFAQASAFVARVDRSTTFVQAMRGSLRYNERTNDLLVDNQPGIGRGGLVIVAFLDYNGNGKRDPKEPDAPGLRLRINGGRMEREPKDGSIRVSGLEAFAPYLIEIDKNSFDDIAWQVKKPIIKVTAEPNHFKLVEVPVSVQGEVSGTVYLETGKGLKGLGGITVNIFQDSRLVSRTLTEADGYFNYLGLAPGAYTARVDSVQLQQLKMVSSSGKVAFDIKTMLTGDYAEGLKFVLQPENIAADPVVATGKEEPTPGPVAPATMADAGTEVPGEKVNAGPEALAKTAPAQVESPATIVNAAPEATSPSPAAGVATGKAAAKTDARAAIARTEAGPATAKSPDPAAAKTGAGPATAKTDADPVIRGTERHPDAGKTGRYLIVTGSYSSLQAARRMSKALARKNINTRIVLPYEGSPYYRVAVADFTRKEEALQTLPQYRKQHGPTTWVLYLDDKEASQIISPENARNRGKKTNAGTKVQPQAIRKTAADIIAGFGLSRHNTTRKIIARIDTLLGARGKETLIDASKSNRYFIVTGAYSTLSRARRVKAALARKNISSQIILPYEGSRYYRVAVADFTRKEEALQALPQYRKQHGETTWVLHFDEEEGKRMVPLDDGKNKLTQNAGVGIPARKRSGKAPVSNSHPAPLAGRKEDYVDVTTADRHFVVAGSYSSLHRARRVKAALARNNISSQIILPYEGAPYYRVAVADFAQKEKALRALLQLKKQFGGTIWVLSH